MGSSQASVGAGLRGIAGLRCYVGLQRIQHLDRAPHMVLQKWMWNCGRSSMNNYGTYVEHMWNKYGTYKHIWWTRVIDGICLLFSHNFQINPNQDVSKPSFFSFFFHILGGWRSIPGLSGVVYHGALVWILLRLSQGQLTYVTGALMPPWETGML